MLDSGAGVGRPGRIRGVRDIFRGWGELGNTPYGLNPAIVLALIYGVQALDSEAFSFAGPAFVRERGIEIPQIINVSASSASSRSSSTSASATCSSAASASRCCSRERSSGSGDLLHRLRPLRRSPGLGPSERYQRR